MAIIKREREAKGAVLKPWEPLREWGDLARIWAWPWEFAWPSRTEPSETWFPRMDVFRRNGDLVVKTDLPGLKKEEVKVSVEEGELVLEGERKHETEVEEENYYRSERAYGSFRRRLPLPEGADPAKVTAKFSDGVLEIHVPLPVASKPEPRKITIG
jgi:HSP20 family protein